MTTYTAHKIVRAILRLAAIATLILGAITLLAPNFVVSISDGYSNGNFHLVRFIGTALIGFGVMNWLYSTFEDLSSTLPAIYGNIVSLGLAIGVDIFGLISNHLSPSAWLISAIHITFFIAFIKCAVLIGHTPKKRQLS